MKPRIPTSRNVAPTSAASAWTGVRSRAFIDSILRTLLRSFAEVLSTFDTRNHSREIDSHAAREPVRVRSRRSGSQALLLGGCRVPEIALEGEEDVHDARVELRPGCLAEPTARLLVGEALPVRPVGRHRVVGVADE